MVNNKKSKILIGCLALLLVLSVGYALFSQNITINGTATAKGEFDIAITCEPDITDELSDALIKLGFSETEITSYRNAQNSYENDICTVSGNEVTYSVGLLAPAAKRLFTIKVTNAGSIPIHLSEVQRGRRTYTGGITLTDGTIKRVEEFSSESKETILWDEPLLSAFDIKGFDINDFETPNPEDLVLNTGDSLYFLVDASLPVDFYEVSTAYGTTYTSMDFSVSASDKFIFAQITD